MFYEHKLSPTNLNGFEFVYDGTLANGHAKTVSSMFVLNKFTSCYVFKLKDN